jgi:rod shape-determining protein MreC
MGYRMAGPGWKWARGRGAKQLPLIVCLVIALTIAVMGRMHAPIFDGARAALSDWTAPALSTLRGPLTAAQNGIGDLAGIFTIYSENSELRQENTELHKWQQVALSLEDRLRSYQKLLNAVPEAKSRFITARVIGESSRPFVKTMILNAGTAQNVAKGQAVANERGLLGRIYVTGENTSWVILLSDLNSRVPVVIEPSHRRAILIGDNTPAPQLELDVSDGPVRPGDRVLTTGDGGLLPPDVPIGVVAGMGAGARVELFATPADADAVNILDYSIPDPPGAEPVPAANARNAEADSLTSVASERHPAPPLLRSVPTAPDPAEVPEELDR